jgi:hypothetical protein
VDTCCDMLGHNALAPLIYSAFENSTQQVKSLAGKDLICNPPYGKIPMFYYLLDAAFKMDDKTRAYFIVPYKVSGP